MSHQQKMITLFKGLLLDDWTIHEYANIVVAYNPKGERAFIITPYQLSLLKEKILLHKEAQPTRNIYKLMPLSSATSHLN